MTYKCLRCGATFEDADFATYKESYGLPGGYYETLSDDRCPCCGSDDYQQAHRCRDCGEYFLPDEMTDGWCDDCLMGSIDPDELVKFLTEGVDRSDNEGDLLTDYVFWELWEIPDKQTPFVSSRAMKDDMKKIVLEHVHDHRKDAQKRFEHYVDRYARQEYAEWLTIKTENEKERR